MAKLSLFETDTRKGRERELKRNEREIAKRLAMERKRAEHEAEVARVMEIEGDIEESRGGYSKLELAAAKAKQKEEKEARKRRKERLGEYEDITTKKAIKKVKQEIALKKAKAKYLPSRIVKIDRWGRKRVKSVFSKDSKKRSHGGIHLI